LLSNSDLISDRLTAQHAGQKPTKLHVTQHFIYENIQQSRLDFLIHLVNSIGISNFIVRRRAEKYGNEKRLSKSFFFHVTDDGPLVSIGEAFLSGFR